MTNEEYVVSAADIRAHDWQKIIEHAREAGRPSLPVVDMLMPPRP